MGDTGSPSVQVWRPFVCTSRVRVSEVAVAAVQFAALGRRPGPLISKGAPSAEQGAIPAEQDWPYVPLTGVGGDAAARSGREAR